MVKVTDAKTIHVRIPKSTWDRIFKRAKEKGESASSEIRRVLYREFGPSPSESKEGIQ